jgi:hypothetical protein
MSEMTKELSQEDDNTRIVTHVDEDQWINELRLALSRGCDLGTIRNIGKCRPLTSDLRLQIWKVNIRQHTNVETSC